MEIDWISEGKQAINKEGEKSTHTHTQRTEAESFEFQSQSFSGCICVCVYAHLLLCVFWLSGCSDWV